MVPPPDTGLAALGISDYFLHAFAEALQGVLAARVSTEVTSPSPYAPTGNISALYLLHIRFSCGVAVDGEIHPIWEVVPRHPK